MRLYTLLICFLLIATVSACSSSGTTVVDEGPREPSLEEKLNALPEYETFDPSAYPAQAIVEDEAIEHRVPVELMEGRASKSLLASASGYRVQIALAREKGDADKLVDEATQWLLKMREEKPDISVFNQNLPIHNIYLQPYFRIRIGDFASRRDAEVLRAEIESEYPGALVVVDQIDTN